MKTGSDCEKTRAQLIAELAELRAELAASRIAGQAPGENEKTFRSLLESFPNGSVNVFDRDLRYILAGGKGLAAVGLSPEQLIGKRLDEVFPPPEVALVTPYYLKALAGQNVEFELSFLDHSYLMSAAPLRDASAAVYAIIVVAQDNTERKRAEEALRRSDQELADLFDNGVLGLRLMGPDGEIIRANQAELDLLGYGHDEYVGRRIEDFHVDAEAAGDILRRLRGGETLHNYQAQLRCKDDSIKVVLISANVLWRDGRFIHTRCFTRDITERVLAEAALYASEERFSKAFSASPHPMTLTTLDDGRYIDVNEATLRVTGYTREEILGRTSAELRIWADEADRDRVLRALKEKGSVRDFEVGLRSKNGEIRVVLLAADLIELDGRACLLTASNDITERKLVERERELLLAREQAARAEAEIANRAKDEFLATISHELRTPLNAILGWAHILSNGTLDEAMMERGLQTIERNAKSQARLIEDLLDISRIITGQLRLDARPVELASVINSALDVMRPAAEAKAIRLLPAYDYEAGVVLGDPNRLQQVIWNLLSNAIKFTPEGGRVEVRLDRRGANARITVSDTGQGINAEFLPYVFDRFRQADNTTTRRHGGLGLGLAIARNLVELHGGSVSADSVGENLGSSFTVSLPLARSQHAAPAPGQGRAERSASEIPRSGNLSPATLRGLRVMVVDDEAGTVEIIAMALSRYGAEVKTATAPREAFEVLKEWRPDMLVCDIGMPGEDGYQFIRRVRALGPERGGQVRAIALTAYAALEDRMRALSSGFERHLAKPVEPDKLAAAVARLAGRLANSGRGE